MRNQKAFKQSILFGVLVLSLSYLVFWGPLALFHIPTISFVDKTKGPIWAIVLFLLGGFIPSVLGLILSRVTDGKDGFRNLVKSSFKVSIDFKWYMLIFTIIIISGFTQVLLNSIILKSKFDYSIFVKQLPSLIPLIIIGPLSEEYGWRGYFQEKLQVNFSQFNSSIIIGIIWGLWHIPLFYMVGTSQNTLHIPFLSFIVNTISTSIIITWIYNNSKGSVWSAIFFHWIYTYISQVISTGITRSMLYNWLEPIPYLVIASTITILWKRGKQKEEKRPA